LFIDIEWANMEYTAAAYLLKGVSSPSLETVLILGREKYQPDDGAWDDIGHTLSFPIFSKLGQLLIFDTKITPSDVRKGQIETILAGHALPKPLQVQFHVFSSADYYGKGVWQGLTGSRFPIC
jgi:hypothetical protein